MAHMLTCKKLTSNSKSCFWKTQALSFLIILLSWFAFIAWRPLLLGFYHDDWVLLTIQYPYGQPMIIGGIYRPLSVFFNYLAVILFEQNVYYWHIYGSALVLTCSLAIYGCVYRLVNVIYDNNFTAQFSGIFSSVSWMLLPWGFGYSAWPAMFPGMIAILFFTFVITCITYESKKLQAFAMFLFLIAGLTYEAFWLTFISLCLIKLSCQEKINWKNIAGTFVAYLFIQILLLAWNRGVNLYFNGPNKVVAKSINFDFLDIISHVPYRVLSFLGIDASNIEWLFGISSGVLAFLFLWVCRGKKVAIVLLACILGASTSLFIYALAGYAVMPSGIFSRTFIAINLWLVIGLGVCFPFFIEKIIGKLRVLFLLGCVLILSYLGFQTVKATFYWAESWEFQSQLMTKVPFQEIEMLPNSKVGVILLLPNRQGKMEAINAFWDATAMFYLKAPGLRKEIEKEDLVVMVSRQGEWLSEWDGKSVSQSWCHSPKQLIGSHQIKFLYAVDLETGALISLQKGWSYGCQPN